MADVARERAEESVSARFTRVMNATTSRWGVLTDPSMVGFAVAPPAIGALAATRLEASAALVTSLEVLMIVPIVVAVTLTVALRSARAKVVDWLASQPFPVENMNAILNGLGEALEVTFRDPAPDAKALNAALERVSPDAFVSKNVDETGDARVVEIRLGVVDDKRNPSGSNHRRFARVKALVAEVLVPLADTSPIAEIRVK